MTTEPRPLSDFFTTVETDKDKQPAPRFMSVEVDGKRKPYREPVGPYCIISGPGLPFRSLWVTASDEVMSDISARMLGIEYDSIYFELIRPTGAVNFTLYAKYNLILGSRIIGYVRADTIPQES